MWKPPRQRRDSGPAALHRLPESVAHMAEALWMKALDEAKRRTTLEQRDGLRNVRKIGIEGFADAHWIMGPR